ncbi:M20 family metallo-hydrolase [Cytobacillus firmus]|uniref:M20 family metallo-hydrolase n=1 Tax=Cytobacillus firmus TaxID=1399 RepID=UPI0021ADDD94|nr:M20 family metallo-hydrolase [Cytobacillus firmus]
MDVKNTLNMEVWLEEHLKLLNLTDELILPNGFTRLGYSEEEAQAMEVFKSIAIEMGLSVKKDFAGNMIARWIPGNQPFKPALAFGSHLDTVKGGGGYDGAAGVVCALGAVKKLKEEGFQPDRPIEVICFASEESSRFGISTIGSKAMAGILNPEELENIQDEEGMTVKEAVELRGVKWEEMPQAERNISELKSFVELHIEQGMRLENAGADFGSVTAVACPIRLKIKIVGRTGHTGTAPMGGRIDALVATAPLITFVAETAERLSIDNEYPIVATASTLALQPNTFTAIPGSIELGIDIRSVDDALKNKMVSLIREKCSSISEDLHVKITINTLVNNASIMLSSELSQELKEIGESLGYQCLMMESGAGHDVMNMSRKWPSGLIFIRCKEGISHHPDEFAAIKDLSLGTNILVEYIKRNV